MSKSVVSGLVNHTDAQVLRNELTKHIAYVKAGNNFEKVAIATLKKFGFVLCALEKQRFVSEGLKTHTVVYLDQGTVKQRDFGFVYYKDDQKSSLGKQVGTKNCGQNIYDSIAAFVASTLPASVDASTKFSLSLTQLVSVVA